jgi:hypothetical protein
VNKIVHKSSFLLQNPELIYISGWISIINCAYNTSEYPRPSIYKAPNCYNLHKTDAIDNAMSFLGQYHKFRLEYTLMWDLQETVCPKYTCNCHSKTKLLIYYSYLHHLSLTICVIIFGDTAYNRR